MDEVSVNALKSFKDKDFVDVSKEDFDLGMPSPLNYMFRGLHYRLVVL